MAAEYLRKLKALMDEVAPEEFVEIRLECKHFFSGAALYANGKICVTLTPVGLALKLPEESRALLEQTGATHLRYSPEGPVKKDQFNQEIDWTAYRAQLLGRLVVHWIARWIARDLRPRFPGSTIGANSGYSNSGSTTFSSQRLYSLPSRIVSRSLPGTSPAITSVCDSRVTTCPS